MWFTTLRHIFNSSSSVMVRRNQFTSRVVNLMLDGTFFPPFDRGMIWSTEIVSRVSFSPVRAQTSFCLWATFHKSKGVNLSSNLQFVPWTSFQNALRLACLRLLARMRSPFCAAHAFTCCIRFSRFFRYRGSSFILFISENVWHLHSIRLFMGAVRRNPRYEWPSLSKPKTNER